MVSERREEKVVKRNQNSFKGSGWKSLSAAHLS